MASITAKNKLRKRIKFVLLFSVLLFLILLFFANRYVEPVLRKRLHSLIIQGSDSLYTYRLGDLHANFFGGNVEVESLHIRIDSTYYNRLLSVNALPSLTMELDLERGNIRGLSVFALLFGKRIEVEEIISTEANVQLSRHVRDAEKPANIIPLWKTLQPAVKSINVDRINLNGVKLLYKNADTSKSVKLQFDRCEAVLKNVRIDSAAATDTTRMAFAKSVSMNFYDLKFRTPDSAYKMKAELIRYSSVNRLLQITDFKIQSTLEKEEFFKTVSSQQSHYEIECKEAIFTNLHLDRFIHSNILAADSVFIKQSQAFISADKTLPISPISKFGKYPHQLLLKANATFKIGGIRIEDAMINYTERGAKSGKEGSLRFTDMNVLLSNVTNDPELIKTNSECIAVANAKIFGNSPIRAKFTFHLNSTEGAFKVEGNVKNINAAQLKTVAEPLGNVKIQSLNISNVQFQLTGDEHSAKGKLQMHYNNLAITLQKKDEESGQMKTKKFLSKILNKFSLYPANPMDGKERVATNAVYARLSSKGFFGIVWKTIFAGMQNIMMKSGRYE